LKAAVLHFYETADSFMAPDFTLLRELKGADVTVVRVPAMHHHHFADLGAWVGRIRGLATATLGSADTGHQYETVLDLSRAFLDDRLKGATGGFSRALKRATSSGRPDAQVLVERLGSNGRH
jgi:hypothetical protein